MSASKPSRCHKPHRLFAAGRIAPEEVPTSGIVPGSRVLYWARVYNSEDRCYDIERWQGEVQSLHFHEGNPTHATVLFHVSAFGPECTRTLPLSQIKLDPEHNG